MANAESRKWIEAQKRKHQSQVMDMIIDPVTGKYRQVTLQPKGGLTYTDTDEKVPKSSLVKQGNPGFHPSYQRGRETDR